MAEPSAGRKAAGAEISQAGERRLSRIESLRALAATGVVVGHAWGIAHDFGPDARSNFFEQVIYGSAFGAFMLLALSGYLLFWPFVRHHWGGRSPVDLRQYAFNRAVRILPLYWIAIVLLLIVQEGGGTGEQWWRFMTFSQSFSNETIFTVDGPLWTIVVEVHFYFALPVIALLLARAGRGSLARAALLLGLLGAGSLAIWLTQVTFREPRHLLWEHSFPGVFYFICSGMLLAMFRMQVERRRPRWMDGRAGRTDLWLLAASVLWVLVWWRFKLLPLVTVASFLTIGACVLPLRQGVLVRILDWKALAVVGVASYSTYVWHLPLLENLAGWGPFPEGVAGMFLIAVPLSIVVGLVSYRLIEEPFLRLRKRWSTESAAIAPEGATPEPSPAGAPQPT